MERCPIARTLWLCRCGIQDGKEEDFTSRELHTRSGRHVGRDPVWLGLVVLLDTAAAVQALALLY